MIFEKADKTEESLLQRMRELGTAKRHYQIETRSDGTLTLLTDPPLTAEEQTEITTLATAAGKVRR